MNKCLPCQQRMEHSQSIQPSTWPHGADIMTSLYKEKKGYTMKALQQVGGGARIWTLFCWRQRSSSQLWHQRVPEPQIPQPPSWAVPCSRGQGSPTQGGGWHELRGPLQSGPHLKEPPRGGGGDSSLPDSSSPPWCSLKHQLCDPGHWEEWGMDSELGPSPGFLLDCCCSVAKSMPDSLWPHGLQHTRLPCPSLSFGIC